MYDLQREQKILSLLKEKGSASVHDLSAALYASPATIRRDLTKMERKGLVRRTFGGVLLNASPSGEETSFSLREKDNLNQKRALCQKAAGLIEGNSTIFIDSSSTCLLLVPYLNSFSNLTIVTNGLFLANEVISKTRHKVILPGGVIQPNSNSIVGTDTFRFVEGIHCDRFFFSSSAIDFPFGISESNREQSEIKKQMIANSRLSVCLVDSSKLGKRSLWRTCAITDVDVLITDAKLSEEEKKGLSDSHVKLIITK